MIFYMLACISALCLVVDHEQVDIHVVAMLLGVAVFSYATRHHAIRMTPAYAMVVLGILAGVSATYGIVWLMLGHQWAAVGGIAATATLAWAAACVMPAGVRMLRTVFGQG